ncbi:MAG: ABC transporter permease [Bacteroidota bacterium]|jgi:lipoprotein-releasing system permease protein|nr:ABC transporter permease [Bacteroidota bacterium]
MTVERFIARRYLFGKKRFSFINIISLLATLGIMFGVAALIVVMSVFNGFNGLVTSILQDFDPHLKIERLPRVEGKSMAELRGIIGTLDGVRGVAPFVERKAMVMAGGNANFVWVKGVDPDSVGAVSRVAEKTILGDFRLAQRGGIVLGIALADRMRVLVGDSVVLYSPAGMEHLLTQFVAPTVLRCEVTGIFDSRNKIYDGSYAFLSLGDAQRLFRMTGQYTGYELRLDDVDDSEDVQTRLRDQLGGGWKVLTWFDLHKDLYSVMAIERWSAFILLGIIIAVAVFNILASLTMLVLEKQRDIGILRTMGMPARRVQRIFLLEGVWIGGLGVAAGLVVGLGITWLQAEFGLVKLDQAFIIPAIPVDPRFADIALIVLGTFGLCLLAAWYPAMRARGVKIIDAVRWE